MRHFWLLALLMLGACKAGAPEAENSNRSAAGTALDSLAVEKGLLPDPTSRTFEGRFETRSELGTDKFCAIAEAEGYRVGFLSVYGAESKCEAQGTAKQTGDKVRITLKGKEVCEFDASYDGIVLRFPGAVPSSCASYCSRNANMSGTQYYFVDPGAEAARKTLGREIERLCL